MSANDKTRELIAKESETRVAKQIFRSYEAVKALKSQKSKRLKPLLEKYVRDDKMIELRSGL